MKHIVEVVFGKEQVKKLYEGETLTDDELCNNVKEYEFDTLAEKSAFIKGLFESLGWEDICIPEFEFTQDR